MFRYPQHAVVLGAMAFLSAFSVAHAGAQPVRSVRSVQPEPAAFEIRSANLHRVKSLFDGDTRALWIGDSWALMHHSARLPYGSLMVWPIGQLEAVSIGFHSSGLGGSTDYTFGPGELTPVDNDNGWITETNDDGPARIALPVNNMTRVFGDPALLLDAGWAGPPRVQNLGIRNGFIGSGDLPFFTTTGDNASVRLLYYSPRDLPDLIDSISVLDQDATLLAIPSLHTSARRFWHLGENPDSGIPRVPVSSQINAFATDLPLGTNLGSGPRLVVAEDPVNPLVGSNQYWFLAGGVFYRTDASGLRNPGYYHSVLAGNSWQFKDYATNAQSNGNKRFTDEQLFHWLDVTTIDRTQQPIIIVHIATEQLSVSLARIRIEAILDRFRAAYALIGNTPPKFLLVGSFMHRILPQHEPADRGYIENLNNAMLAITQDNADCAFVSLYAMTDGTYFTSDARGGAGTQQAAREWLDNNGWSTITYGNTTYTLSSTDNGGLNGVLVNDGLHIGSTPAAAFFAKLIAIEIENARRPGNINEGDTVNPQGVTRIP